MTIKKQRETLGMTQAELSVAARVSVATISRIERGGTCHRSTMSRIRAALHMNNGHKATPPNRLELLLRREGEETISLGQLEPSAGLLRLIK